MSDKVELLQRFYDRVWVEGAISEAADFFNTQAEASGLMSDLSLSAQEVHDFVAALLSFLDVTWVQFDKTVEQGDWLSAMGSFEAVLRATGQTVGGSCMIMVRIVDDRIVEAFNCIDFLNLFEKIGLVPKDALALGLAGQRLS